MRLCHSSRSEVSQPLGLEAIVPRWNWSNSALAVVSLHFTFTVSGIHGNPTTCIERDLTLNGILRWTSSALQPLTSRMFLQIGFGINTSVRLGYFEVQRPLKLWISAFLCLKMVCPFVIFCLSNISWLIDTGLSWLWNTVSKICYGNISQLHSFDRFWVAHSLRDAHLLGAMDFGHTPGSGKEVEILALVWKSKKEQHI